MSQSQRSKAFFLASSASISCFRAFVFSSKFFSSFSHSWAYQTSYPQMSLASLWGKMTIQNVLQFRPVHVLSSLSDNHWNNVWKISLWFWDWNWQYWNNIYSVEPSTKHWKYIWHVLKSTSIRDWWLDCVPVSPSQKDVSPSANHPKSLGNKGAKSKTANYYIYSCLTIIVRHYPLLLTTIN